jgi:hypothetical protein
MSGLSRYVRRALRLPGVPEARHVTERAVAPYLRADLTSMHETLLEHNHRIGHAEQVVHASAAAVADLERYQPAVLNAIASTNGTARIVRRELGDVRAETAALADRIERVEPVEMQVEVMRSRVDGMSSLPADLALLRSDIEPHLDTLKWLTERVETIRAEMLYELRYGRDPLSTAIESKVIRPGAIDTANGPLRLNLGCGHIALDGFVNVDMREIPGVDVVSAIDDLPFEPGTVGEIFSAHVLEHFPELELSRRLLPYWVSLLRPGGVFRAVVPDLPSMIGQYERGDIDFEALRKVAYGGQEYEGDFHFTAFTTERLTEMLTDVGLVDVDVIEQGRPNGDCLEFEISARRVA